MSLPAAWITVLLLTAAIHPAQAQKSLSPRQAEDLKVRKIYFEFPIEQIFLRSELRAAMRTQVGDSFRRRFYASDMVTLINLYRGRGYRDAFIATKKLTAKKHQRLDIQLTVDSGSLWTVAEVVIDNGAPFSADELRTIAGLEPGDALDYAAVLEGERELLGFLNRSGYAHATVNNHIQDRQRSAQVVYRVEPGPKMYFAETYILNAENLATRPSLVNRYLAFRPGDLYNPDAMARSRQALAHTGLFRAVALAAPDSGRNDSLQGIYVHLQERKYIRVGAHALFDNTVEPRVSTNLQHTNWLGRGARIGTNASWGRPVQGAQLFATELNVLRSGADLTFTAGVTEEWGRILRFADPSDPRQFDLLTTNDQVLAMLLPFAGEEAANVYISTASYDYTSIERLWQLSASLARHWGNLYYTTFTYTATRAHTFPETGGRIVYAPSVSNPDLESVALSEEHNDFFGEGSADDFFGEVPEGKDNFFDESSNKKFAFVDYSEGQILVDQAWADILAERSRALNWKLEVQRDSRDDRFMPRRGTLMRLSALYAVNLGNRPTFVLDADGEVRRYQNLAFIANELVVALAARAMQTGSLRTGRALPQIYWKKLGGEGSVRGVEREDITTAGGGRLGLNFRAELRYRISGLGLVGFWDRGQVWRHRTDVGLANMVDGYGLGLRYTFGIPLRLDLARNDGFDRSRTLWFYFSIGQAF